MKLGRRGFLCATAAAVATAALPVAAEAAAAPVCASRGAFLAYKMAELDALYEAFADQVAQTMWGNIAEPIAVFGECVTRDATPPA